MGSEWEMLWEGAMRDYIFKASQWWYRNNVPITSNPVDCAVQNPSPRRPELKTIRNSLLNDEKGNIRRRGNGSKAGDGRLLGFSPDEKRYHISRIHKAHPQRRHAEAR